jgi:hypothetical protein
LAKCDEYDWWNELVDEGNYAETVKLIHELRSDKRNSTLLECDYIITNFAELIIVAISKKC